MISAGIGIFVKVKLRCHHFYYSVCCKLVQAVYENEKKVVGLSEKEQFAFDRIEIYFTHNCISQAS